MSGVPSPFMSATHSGVVPTRAAMAGPVWTAPVPLEVPMVVVLVTPLSGLTPSSVGGGPLKEAVSPPGTTVGGGTPAQLGSGFGGLLHRPLAGLQVPAR